MVFFSTYKSSRLVAPGFLAGPIQSVRSYSEYYAQRPWNGLFNGLFPSDVRFYCWTLPVFYWIHRYQVDFSLHKDYEEKVIINRWGPTLDEARKRLTPCDQVRVKNYYQYELYNSFFGPKEVNFVPNGCPLPGPDFYGGGGHGGAHH